MLKFRSGIDIENQPKYTDTDRIEDIEIFDSNIPQQEDVSSGNKEDETDDETPVDRFILHKFPDRHRIVRDDQQLNLLPNRLTTTPHPEIAMNTGSMETIQEEFDDKPEIFKNHNSEESANPPTPLPTRDDHTHTRTH